MKQYLTQMSHSKYWDYFILVSRFLIGIVFIGYGYGKLTEGQFGISPEELATPLQDLSFFRVSWYLFDQQPFKAFIGISQLLCGFLLILNRTAILGAFLFLPIVTTILIIDLSFMPKALAMAFAWRLSFYILLDILILLHYKDKMLVLWRTITQNVTTKFKYPIWVYLLLPLSAIVLEIAGVLPKALVQLISDPSNFLASLKTMF